MLGKVPHYVIFSISLLCPTARAVHTAQKGEVGAEGIPDISGSYSLHSCIFQIRKSNGTQSSLGRHIIVDGREFKSTKSGVCNSKSIR
jgi:hypothetical protein